MKKFLPVIFFFVMVTAFGQAVQDFTVLNIADNKMVSLSEFQSCEGVVIIFTSNTCPYDNYYIERVRALINQYKGSIQFILVNSFTEPKEKIEAMTSQYTTWGLSVPYLADKDQVAMDCLGAKKSAESFLLRKQDGHYTIFYHGAIDDNPQVASDVSHAYLKENLDNLLAKRKATINDIRPVGCIIRKK